MSSGEGEERTTRRKVLLTLSSGGLVGIAGCSERIDDRASSDQDATTTVSSTDSETDTSETDSRASPSIQKFTATPRENGAQLAVTLEGGAETELSQAAFTYGDIELVETVDGQSVTVTEVLSGTHRTTNESRQVVAILRDNDGRETSASVNPDETAPNVSVVDVDGAETTGALMMEIEAADNVGLSALTVELGGETVISLDPDDIGGRASVPIDESLSQENEHDLTIGASNDIAVTAVDWNGNTRTREQSAYVREYEPVEDQRVDVGAWYLPFFDDKSQWDECTDARPEVGRYGMADTEAVSRHVDLMQGFGINRLVHQFTVPENSRAFKAQLSEPLPSTMPVEIYFNYTNAMAWRGDRTVVEQFEAVTTYAREELLQLDNYATFQGKPVVTLWAMNWLPWGGTERAREVKSAIFDEWGDYEGYVSFLRDAFTQDGVEPFLVGMINSVGDNGLSDEEIELASHFDAVTNWFIELESGGSIAWSDAVEEIERTYEVLHEFAIDYGLEFAPMAFYGFDDRSNGCWGENRHIERDPSHLGEALQLADEYRTIDRVNVASFNDWPEGHMVEPGTFRGDDHGTDYLEVISEFVES